VEPVILIEYYYNIVIINDNKFIFYQEAEVSNEEEEEAEVSNEEEEETEVSNEEEEETEVSNEEEEEEEVF